MGNTETKEIRIVADDESLLYASFSPDAEFSDQVKSYIRSKMAGGNYRQRVDLTVISREPIDEERFRSAASNWIRDERVTFRKREKDTLIRLIGLLIFGSIMIVASIAGERQYDVLKYSLMPVMGSLSLGSAARILIMEMPVIRVERWFFKKIAENSVIRFEYGQEDADSLQISAAK